MAQTTEPVVTIGDYVDSILKQDGLYVGLGLGAVLGALLGSRDINVAISRAKDVLKATESLTADWTNQISNNDS